MEEHITLHIDQLAEYIFLHNHKKQCIYLDINGLRDAKDMFCLCLDLLCKGMVLKFGQGNKVYVDDISLEQMHELMQCLKYAGIECHMNVYTPPEVDSLSLDTSAASNNNKAEPMDLPLSATSPHDIIVQSVNHIHKLPNQLQLNHYHFLLRINNMFYVIHFDLLRV